MINTLKLEKQVHCASLANRMQRHDIVRRWHLLGDAMTVAATKPIVLVSAVLAGFCLGYREKNPSAAPVKKWDVMEKILPLAVSLLVNSAHHEKQHPD